MDTSQYKVFTERLGQIQSVVDRIDSDLKKDREDIQNFSLRLGSLENQQSEIWKILNNLPERTRQEVKTSINPIVDATNSLKEVILEKKFVTIKLPQKSFWKWLFRR